MYVKTCISELVDGVCPQGSEVWVKDFYTFIPTNSDLGLTFTSTFVPIFTFTVVCAFAAYSIRLFKYTVTR